MLTPVAFSRKKVFFDKNSDGTKGTNPVWDSGSGKRVITGLLGLQLSKGLDKIKIKDLETKRKPDMKDVKIDWAKKKYHAKKKKKRRKCHQALVEIANGKFPGGCRHLSELVDRFSR